MTNKEQKYLFYLWETGDTTIFREKFSNLSLQDKEDFVIWFNNITSPHINPNINFVELYNSERQTFENFLHHQYPSLKGLLLETRELSY